MSESELYWYKGNKREVLSDEMAAWCIENYGITVLDQSDLDLISKLPEFKIEAKLLRKKKNIEESLPDWYRELGEDPEHYFNARKFINQRNRRFHGLNFKKAALSTQYEEELRKYNEMEQEELQKLPEAEQGVIRRID